jgi:anaerobic magnesium-protoporphyrin IX monomethyl ester cyclase
MTQLDLVLIYPPLSVSERYGKRSTGQVGGHLPPLGIASIAAHLLERGYKVDVIDALALNMSVDDIVEFISESRPKAVGFSAPTSIFFRAVYCAEAIKKKLPDVLILIGGHHAAIMPREVMRNHNCFDLLVYGEGELTAHEIMEKFKTVKYKREALLNSDLSKISGICYRSGEKISQSEPRALIPDLDTLTFPARHLLPMDRYIPLPNQYKRKPVVHMVVIRGCPYQCAFCSNNAVFGKKIRARSPASVVEEIEHVMHEYGAKDISFWDDMMTAQHKWMGDFCRLILQKGLDITWTCYSRVDTVTKELLKKMKDAGCWNIFFGYEAGDQQLLNNINKGISLEQIRRCNRWCKEVGIEIRASFMLGLPGETPKLAQKTIDFAKELDPDYPQFCITTPYPGTELYRNAEKWGKLDKDFKRYNIWEPVFIPYGYENSEQLVQMERQAIRQFYFRPKYILSRLVKTTSLQDIKRNLLGLRFMLGFVK